METYTTNSFCNNVLTIQTPFPTLKITFLYKFFLLLSVYFYCTRYIEIYAATSTPITIKAKEFTLE